MSRLGIVTKFEFVRTVTKRSFWLRTLSIPVLLAAVIGLSLFSGKVSQQADQNVQKSQFSTAVLDDSGYLSPSLLRAVGAKRVSDKTAGITMARQGQVDAFVYYPAHPVQDPIEVYAKDDGLASNNKYTAVAANLFQAAVVARLGGGDNVRLLQQAPQTQLTTYKDGQETKGLGRVVAPGIFLVLFYAVIVLLGNQMLTSTTEEKENRVIEMILTSVTARTIIVGKIISLCCLGVIQITAILAPVFIAYFGFRGQLHLPAIDLSQISFAAWPIVTGAIIFIGGFMLFTGMLVAIGAAVPTAKEAGGFFAFVMILVFVPFYALGAITTSPDQMIVKVMTYFPLTSPITLFLRNAVGNLQPSEAIIALTILYIAGSVILALAIRIFRFGSLEYARKLSLREIFSRRA